MKKTSLMVAMLIMAGAMALYAQMEQESSELQNQITALDKTALSLGEEKTLQKLSGQLGVSYEVLAQQRQQTGLGMGELFIANSMATRLQATAPDKTFDALVQQFKSGQGWGEIAKENGLTLGKVVSRMKRSNTALEREQRNQARKAEARNAGSGSGQRAGKSHSNIGRRSGSGAGHGRN